MRFSFLVRLLLLESLIMKRLVVKLWEASFWAMCIEYAVFDQGPPDAMPSVLNDYFCLHLHKHLNQKAELPSNLLTL